MRLFYQKTITKGWYSKMTANEILEKWAVFSKYDPDQKTYMLGNNSYDVKKGNDLISKIHNTYDKSGGLAVIYAKLLCAMLLKDRKASFHDILSNPHEYETAREMWGIFNSVEVLALEKQYMSKISSMAESMVKGRLIGDAGGAAFDAEMLFRAVETAINGLEKVRTDLYAKGDVVGSIAKISAHVHVFETLGDCLIALERAEDGMYLCYIRMRDSADGYFGFFVKNNRNLFSVHERVDEAYAGSHKMNRNARYAENKLYDLFPYEHMFSFSEHDYKGYATRHIIDADALSLFNLGPGAYYPIIVAASLLKSKFEGSEIDSPLTYTDSLLRVNLLPDGGSGEELAVLENSLIARQHDGLTLGFTVSGIKSGAYAAEFHYKENEGAAHNETGIFKNENQLFVQLYGDGFDYDFSEALRANTHLLLPGKGTEKDSEPNSEFVGTEKRMKLQAYYAARKALAEHIEGKMDEELKFFLNSFGDVRRWYIPALTGNIEKLNEIIRDYAIDVQNGNKRFCEAGWRSTNEPLFSVVRVDGTYPVDTDRILNSEKKGERFRFTCNITGNLCNVFFVIKPNNHEALKLLTGLAELPKIIQGWQCSRYVGNPILNMVDPVDQLKTPFEYSNHIFGKAYTYFDFAFAVGFSKRGLNKLLAAHQPAER